MILLFVVADLKAQQIDSLKLKASEIPQGYNESLKNCLLYTSDAADE